MCAARRCTYARGDRRRMRRETSGDSIQRSAGEDIGLAARIPLGGVPLFVRGAPGCALSCRRSSSHVSESTASIPRVSSSGSASVRTTDALVRRGADSLPRRALSSTDRTSRATRFRVSRVLLPHRASFNSEWVTRNDKSALISI